jgi:superfamily II DNA helicase RecQ
VSYLRLYAGCAAIASSAGLPLFIIFHDGTLRAISRRGSRKQRKNYALEAWGERRIATYGAQTLDVVKDSLKTHPLASL